MKPIIVVVLMFAALLVTPVSAVTYNDEYYKLNDMLDNYNSILHDGSTLSFGDHYKTSASLSLAGAAYYELRRQTILMEKQNELLEENNELLRGMQAKVESSVTRFNVDPDAFVYPTTKSNISEFCNLYVDQIKNTTMMECGV